MRNDLPDTITVNCQTISLKWCEALQCLQIGGEQGYGWGQITLSQPKDWNSPSITDGELHHWGSRWEWQSNGNEISITVPSGTHIPIHALAAEFKGEQPITQHLAGSIEPWLGWEYQGNFRLGDVRIVYEPGAKVNEEFKALLAPWGYLYL